jgi:hypothetical protein
VVKCAKCDEVLYTGYDIVEPREVLEAVGGKCPRCGRTLSLMPERVEVMPRFPLRSQASRRNLKRTRRGGYLF